MIVMCDYDGEIPDDFAQRLKMVAGTQRLRIRSGRFDRTRHGWHLVLDVAGRLSAARVVLVQALLGSDWRRESFNAQRVLRLRAQPKMWKDGRWNVLYHSHTRSVSL